MFGSSDKQLLKKALQIYVGKHVLDRVLSLREHAFELDGVQTEVTLLFSDVVGFTSVPSPLPQGELSGFLNRVLDVTLASVARYGGTVDSLSGDQVFAYWTIANHAEKACACAEHIIENLEALDATHQETGLPSTKLRIGISTGRVYLGNYGSEGRMKYTALGDEVNLTYRLCCLANGTYKVPILISDATNSRLPAAFKATEVGSVRIKGRDEIVRLFGLRG